MLLLPDKKAVVLSLRHPARVTTLIPRHQIINDTTVAVKHGIEETKVLRNLGIDVPSPINTYYDYPGRFTPMHHQRETAAFLTLNNRCFVFNDMGLGKSISALWAADYLMQIGYVHRVLILSTITCMQPVWEHELFVNLPHRTSIIVHGSREVRKKALHHPFDYYILNHDGLARVPGLVEIIVSHKQIDLIIVDEAACLRNPSTILHHKMQKLIQPHHRLWLLTGLPCPNSAADAFGLGKLVSPQNFPQYYGRWLASVQTKINDFKWVDRPGAMDMVYAALQPAIRFKKEDCLDLPPVVHLNRKVSLSKEQTAAYKTMKEKLFLLQAGQPVTAVNAAVKLGKLLQICCGCVRNDVETYSPVPCAPRLAALKEAVEEANAKVIVFVPYTGALNQVSEYLEKENISNIIIDGSVTGRKRAAALNAFCNHTNPHVLVANPDTAAHGLNLTVADTICWFSPIHSLDTYIQANERTNRPGQCSSVRVIHLGSCELEWKIYAMLEKKDLAQQTLLSMYEEEMKT